MWWKLLLLLGLAAVIVFSFITPAPQQIIGESSRIFYYHIPMAWIAVLAFAMSMIYSVRYLKSKNFIEDNRAKTAAALGAFVFDTGDHLRVDFRQSHLGFVLELGPEGDL